MRAVLTLAGLCLFTQWQQAQASPITYTFSGTFSGTIGASVFSNVRVDLSANFDTANTITGATAYTNTTPLLGTVTIAGIGTATITNLQSVNNAFTGSAKFVAGGGTLISTTDPIAALAGYNLNSSIGPVSSSLVYSGGVGMTSLGVLNFGSPGSVPGTFTATLGSATPELGTWSGVVLGLGALAMKRRIGRA